MQLHFDELCKRLVEQGYAHPVEGYPSVIELELRPTFGTDQAEGSFILSVGRLCEANKEAERRRVLQRTGYVFTY